MIIYIILTIIIIISGSSIIIIIVITTTTIIIIIIIIVIVIIIIIINIIIIIIINSYYYQYFPPGAGDRELGCIKCLPCSFSCCSSFAALAPLLFASAFVLSHFFCKVLRVLSFLLQDTFIDRLRREQCGPTLDIDEQTGHRRRKFARFFGAHFGSKPDRCNVSVRRGPDRL